MTDYVCMADSVPCNSADGKWVKLSYMTAQFTSPFTYCRGPDYYINPDQAINSNV